jgi:hypothetical protein
MSDSEKEYVALRWLLLTLMFLLIVVPSAAYIISIMPPHLTKVAASFIPLYATVLYIIKS